MFWLILVILVVVSVVWSSHNTEIKGKAQLESIAPYISQIERSPSLCSGYDKFIELWKESTCIQGVNFISEGYYTRILMICEAESSNVKAWQLLGEVIPRVKSAMSQPHKSKTFGLLLNGISKELHNYKTRQIITPLIFLIYLAREDIVEFINFFLGNTLILGKNPQPDRYIINLPIKVYNLRSDPRYNDTYRVDFDLIYFELNEGNFSSGYTRISYNLDKLFEIFQDSLQGENSVICVNLISRTLKIYFQKSSRLSEVSNIKQVHKDLTTIEPDIEALNKELAKVESLIKTIQSSELYQYQVSTYQRGLKLLKISLSKATKVRDGYLQFLKERTLGFYIEDIEPSVFQGKNKEIEWEKRYKAHKEDYDLLKSMIEEYKNLKSGSW